MTNVVCNKCGVKSTKLMRCVACQSVSYCSKEHQKADWKTHKPFCRLMQSKGTKDSESLLDGGHKPGEYVGTLVWTPGTEFKPLPPFPKDRWPPPLGGDDWQGFMHWRFADTPGDQVVVDASTLDALSFPITLAFIFYRLKLVISFRGVGEVRVILMGAASRTEERILTQTDYWAEVGHMLPDIQSLCLCFVGPEVSEEMHAKEKRVSAKVRAVCHRGSITDFLESSPEVICRPLQDHPTIVIGFNTGFGNTNRNLTRDWLPSLLEVANRRLPAVFTCVNDFEDLRGESSIWQQALGARYILDPCRNAFRAITTVHSPGEKNTSWYTANAFLYAIQGYQGDPEAIRSGRNPPELSLKDFQDAVEKVLDARSQSKLHPLSHMRAPGIHKPISVDNEDDHILSLPVEEAAEALSRLFKVAAGNGAVTDSEPNSSSSDQNPRGANNCEPYSKPFIAPFAKARNLNEEKMPSSHENNSANGSSVDVNGKELNEIDGIRQKGISNVMGCVSEHIDLDELD